MSFREMGYKCMKRESWFAHVQAVLNHRCSLYCCLIVSDFHVSTSLQINCELKPAYR